MQRGAFGIILFLLGGLFSIRPSAAMNADSFDRAADLLRKGQYTDALDLYQTLADNADTPNMTAQALLLKATAIGLYLNQPDSALSLLRKIRADYPDSPAAADALFHEGMMLYEQQHYRAAHNTFSLYMDQYPKGFRHASAQSWKAHAGKQAEGKVTSIGPSLSDFTPDTEIRVLMTESARQVHIDASSRILIQDAFTGKELYRGAGPINVTHQNGKLALNHRPSASLQCRVETNGSTLSLNGTRLRGFLMVSLEPNGMQVINHLPLEHYLYGIIPKEMPSGWPHDALKAQAVASRTYALYITSKNRLMPYDVKASTASQVYGGYAVETTSTNAAVNATRGQVLTHNDQLIIAFFHANSAGHTEDAHHVWQVEIPYLKAVPDQFSSNLPNSGWEYYLPYTTASSRLNQAGLNIGKISAISSCEYSPTGRVLRIAVHANNGNTSLSANHFRCLLDEKQIKSTYFKIISGPSGILLKGEGYGHGVGMSQWGANRMAAAGYSHLDILKHYYPGVALATLGNI
jgi:stage II sporulation protein D